MVTKSNVVQAKQHIQAAVDERDEALRELALKIHAHPEVNFQEHQAAAWLTDYLEQEGFTVERGVADLETAFVATWEGEPGGPTIGILAEYDALPGLGHACGHNIIGTSAVGAGVALKAACPQLKGTIKVIGTPAEEGGGGKVIMAEHGIFDNLDAAMMTHPSNQSMVLRGGIACVPATFKFYGKEAHAAAAPHLGISALDALMNSFAAINSLREYFTDDVRLHGIVKHGGDAANIVPGYCEAEFIIRAETVKKLASVKERVYEAVKHSTAAVGATCEIIEGLTFAERNNNVPLAEIHRANLQSLGVDVIDPPEKGGLGSSDIGNVGQIVPTIHPYIKIGDSHGHTHEFAEDSKSETGMIGLNQAAKSMAMTAYDLCTDQAALQRVKAAFKEWQESQQS